MNQQNPGKTIWSCDYHRKKHKKCVPINISNPLAVHERDGNKFYGYQCVDLFDKRQISEFTMKPPQKPGTKPGKVKAKNTITTPNNNTDNEIDIDFSFVDKVNYDAVTSLASELRDNGDNFCTNVFVDYAFDDNIVTETSYWQIEMEMDYDEEKEAININNTEKTSQMPSNNRQNGAHTPLTA